MIGLSGVFFGESYVENRFLSNVDLYDYEVYYDGFLCYFG